MILIIANKCKSLHHLISPKFICTSSIKVASDQTFNHIRHLPKSIPNPIKIIEGAKKSAMIVNDGLMVGQQGSEKSKNIFGRWIWDRAADAQHASPARPLPTSVKDVNRENQEAKSEFIKEVESKKKSDGLEDFNIIINGEVVKPRKKSWWNTDSADDED